MSTKTTHRRAHAQTRRKFGKAYGRYVAQCRQTGVTPVTYRQFVEGVFQ